MLALFRLLFSPPVILLGLSAKRVGDEVPKSADVVLGFAERNEGAFVDLSKGPSAYNQSFSAGLNSIQLFFTITNPKVDFGSIFQVFQSIFRFLW